MSANLVFDYVVVGAGSAGCVLARRLTEDARTTVLLLEAGGGDASPFIQMPAALSIPMNDRRYDWRYRSEPEPHLDGRRLHCPRGRVLGGSSSINGMAYVRGNAMDFEGWAAAGAKGWSYAEVLPYFRKAETHAGGGDDYRGDSGPLHTSNGPLANPLYRAFIAAGVEAGYPRTEDMNGFRQEGFARMDMTVHRGRRWSTANAYLKPALGRANLAVEKGVLATRILMADGRATGVAFRRGGGARRGVAGAGAAGATAGATAGAAGAQGAEAVASARREVIVCGGPINTPQLLMLSGIGPGAHLAEAGIRVERDLPGVGENLQDHLEVYVQQACSRPITLYGAAKPWRKALIGLEWLLFKRGLGATNHFEAGGFIRSRPDAPWPDIQYHFLPMAVSYDGSAWAERHGFQAHVGPMRSKSRGHVRLRSADPREPPRIRFNYMSHEDDWIEMRAAIRATRKIFAQPAFDPYRGEELAPGPEARSDEQIDAFVRAKAESAYHPCGTAKMGTDAMAVVDPHCRVHGVEGLRVVDSSIMPAITTGNLNAPTIMLAEKAADLIRGRDPLPPSNAPWYGQQRKEAD